MIYHQFVKSAFWNIFKLSDIDKWSKRVHSAIWVKKHFNIQVLFLWKKKRNQIENPVTWIFELNMFAEWDLFQTILSLSIYLSIYLFFHYIETSHNIPQGFSCQRDESLTNFLLLDIWVSFIAFDMGTFEHKYVYLHFHANRYATTENKEAVRKRKIERDRVDISKGNLMKL
jgi:hypothetical protein